MRKRYLAVLLGILTLTLVFYIYTKQNEAELVAPASLWNTGSDMNTKKDFESIDSMEILEKVSRLSIKSWSYKSEKSYPRHIGPTSQDFKTQFGLGSSDKVIAVVDGQGVSLAAIQALYVLSRKLIADNSDLRLKIDSIEQKIAKINSR